MPNLCTRTGSVGHRVTFILAYGSPHKAQAHSPFMMPPMPAKRHGFCIALHYMCCLSSAKNHAFSGIRGVIKGECARPLLCGQWSPVCQDAGRRRAHGACAGAHSWLLVGMCSRLASNGFRFELRVGYLCHTALVGQADLSY